MTTVQPRKKRHHQVPEFYLERFASAGKVAVRWRDGKSYDTNPTNVAVEAGFYDIPDGAGGVSREVEDGLASVEADAADVLAEIDRTNRLPGERDHASAHLALFVGLQVVRTSDHRERTMFPARVVEWAGGREVTQDLVAEYLEQVHLGFAPDKREVDAAWTVVRVAMRDAPDTLEERFGVEMMLRSGIEVSSRLLGLHWSLEVDPGGGFITSDHPVVAWRKPSSRDQYEGLGLENSAEMRFPLDPHRQLVMSRRPRRAVLDAGQHRVRHANRDMADACHRFIVGPPDGRREIQRPTMDRHRPVLRFNTGPGFTDGPGGPVPMDGEILHMWTPRGAPRGGLWGSRTSRRR